MSVHKTVELRCDGKTTADDYCPSMHFSTSAKDARREVHERGWVTIRAEDFCPKCIGESMSKKR